MTEGEQVKIALEENTKVMMEVMKNGMEEAFMDGFKLAMNTLAKAITSATNNLEVVDTKHESRPRTLREMLQTDTIGPLRSLDDVENEMDAEYLAEIEEMAKAHGWKELGPLKEWLNERLAQAKTAREDGAQAELERIVHKLDRRTKATGYRIGDIVLARWDGTGLDGLTRPADILAALEDSHDATR